MRKAMSKGLRFAVFALTLEEVLEQYEQFDPAFDEFTTGDENGTQAAD